MKKKNLAFTLAEVLIVIGIIGVVAALTLPNLNHATGDKETVTRVKKLYSNLTEAFDRAQVIYGPYDTWFNDFDCNGADEAICNEGFAKRVTEFMKVSKDCGFDEGCFASGQGIDSLEEYQMLNTYMVTLSDGMSLGFRTNPGLIRADINGPNKGKNQTGNDIFCFDIYNNVLYPGGGYGLYHRSMGVDNVTDEELAAQCLNLNYCAEWIIENGNMDYLKADENGVCPNGVQLSWTQTSCN